MAFPGTYNFSYYRGDTNEFVIRPKTSTGSAFALTGYTAIFKISDVRGPTGVQISAAAVVDASANIVTCTIIPAVGRLLTGTSYVYDVQITNETPNPDVIFTLLTGTITVTSDVTGAV